MSARDVIAAKLALWGYDESMSDGLLAALTAASFSIVHKDEIHAPSVERAIAVAEAAKGTKFGPEPYQYTIATPQQIAAALRELMKEVGRG